MRRAEPSRAAGEGWGPPGGLCCRGVLRRKEGQAANGGGSGELVVMGEGRGWGGEEEGQARTAEGGE